MAMAAPLLATSWAAPAIGAAAGAIFNRKNPIQGALMGGLGGAALGPMMGAAGGLGAAGEAGASPLSAMGYGAAMPAMGGQQAAMLAAQTGGFGAPGLAATTQAAGAAPGLLSGLSNPLVKTGMKMMMPQQQQQPMMASAPMPQVNQRQAPGSMAALGQGTQLGRSIDSRLYR